MKTSHNVGALLIRVCIQDFLQHVIQDASIRVPNARWSRSRCTARADNSSLAYALRRLHANWTLPRPSVHSLVHTYGCGPRAALV